MTSLVFETRQTWALPLTSSEAGPGHTALGLRVQPPGGEDDGYTQGAARVRSQQGQPQTSSLMVAVIPAIPLVGIYPEELKIEKDTCTPVFIAALFMIAGTWKQPRWPSTDEWIEKLWYIYTVEHYSTVKRNAFQ